MGNIAREPHQGCEHKGVLVFIADFWRSCASSGICFDVFWSNLLIICSICLQFGFCCEQSLGLLDAELEPAPVARFLRYCPGLAKQTIGELLGENDDFFLEVLDDFTQTFDFRGIFVFSAILFLALSLALSCS
jgi:Sec7 domain